MNSNKPTSSPSIRKGVSQDRPHVHVRLLETTDVHSNLLPYDYYADNCETSFGFARTATLIHQARQEVPNSILLDNGDFLQGTPISDMTAQPCSGWSAAHPAIMAMNYLRYDAAGLGNHEFNFGLDWLKAALRDAEFPVICANALVELGDCAATDKPMLPPYLFIDRDLTDSNGGQQRLRVGVISLLPPQIVTWDHFHLHNRLYARDMLETAAGLVPRMRAEGADIVVALAHTGFDPDEYYPTKENAALTLAGLPGIDAVLAGHTHEVFPRPGEPDIGGADNAAGTLNGTPAVMAGFRGSHLGVLDLYLQRNGTGWQTVSHKAEARPVLASPRARPTPPDEKLKQLLMPAHRHTLDLIGKPLGKSVTPLHSYLALVRNDPATQLVTRAQRQALASLVQGTEDEALPVLSASAPFKTGGRGGAKYYSDVPSGDLRLRNAADLYAFPNTLCGLRLTGAQLRDWLERAASCFRMIVPGQQDQQLLNPQMPGHNFDVIHGLTYQIDLSQPARYDVSGRLVGDASQRVLNLCFEGSPIDEDANFLMAVNSFRAHGGGPFLHLPETSFAVTSRIPVRNVVVQYLRKAKTLTAVADPVWSFAPMPGTSVIFDTGPGVRAYPQELETLGVKDLGDTKSGFARFRLPLKAN